MHNHPLAKSLLYAFDGLKQATSQEPNLRLHFVIALVTLFVGFVLKLSSVEWAILVLTIFMVLILELLNTTIEELVDLASPQVHPKAKIAKDVAAAAVLLSSIGSVIVGAFLFIPKLF